jgi:predicted enzyme related to lactoylglutathione lyase
MIQALRYGSGMPIEVQAAVPVLYVRSIESALTFYALFGYRRAQSGGDGDARWEHLQSGQHAVLLACVQPPLIQAELPLLIYLYVTDLGAVRDRLADAGFQYKLVGHPDHAPGGELRTCDPDGNVVLVGQRAAAADARTRPTGAEERFSLLKEAAETVSRRGGAPATCQVTAADGGACPNPAELKLADTWGATVWACLTHADEALINAPGAFIASEDVQGLGPWLSRRTPAP